MESHLPIEMILEIATRGSFLWFVRFLLVAREYRSALNNDYWWKRWMINHSSEKEIAARTRALELIEYWRPEFVTACRTDVYTPPDDSCASTMESEEEKAEQSTEDAILALCDSMLRKPKTHQIFVQPYEVLRNLQSEDPFCRFCVVLSFEIIERLIMAIDRAMDQGYRELALWLDPRKEDDPNDSSAENEHHDAMRHGAFILRDLAIAAMRTRRWDVVTRIFEHYADELYRADFSYLLRQAQRYLSYTESLIIFPYVSYPNLRLVLWEEEGLTRYFWAPIDTVRFEDRETIRYWEVEIEMLKNCYEYYSPEETQEGFDNVWRRYPRMKKVVVDWARCDGYVKWANRLKAILDERYDPSDYRPFAKPESFPESSPQNFRDASGLDEAQGPG